MKGINFKLESIQAILNGSKTQTRRLIKPQPIDKPIQDAYEWWHWVDNKCITYDKHSPYRIGETVYIKEALYKSPSYDVTNGKHFAYYKSDNLIVVGGRWEWTHNTLSPLFMPEWATRYFITITDVRAERLQEITDVDAVAEGIIVEKGHYIVVARPSENGAAYATPRDAYFVLWNTINAKWKRVYNTELKIYEFWQFPWCEADAIPIPKTTKHPERYHCIPNPWIFVYTFRMARR